MRGPITSQSTTIMSEKGIEGITPDNDYINNLLCPQTKTEGPNKKGPAKAFLTQLAHKADTRWVCIASFLILRSPLCHHPLKRLLFHWSWANGSPHSAVLTDVQHACTIQQCMSAR
jgi:hypothetical protein